MPSLRGALEGRRALLYFLSQGLAAPPAHSLLLHLLRCLQQARACNKLVLTRCVHRVPGGRGVQQKGQSPARLPEQGRQHGAPQQGQLLRLLPKDTRGCQGRPSVACLTLLCARAPSYLVLYASAHQSAGEAGVCCMSLSCKAGIIRACVCYWQACKTKVAALTSPTV